MKSLILVAAGVAILTAPSAHSRERIENGFHQVEVTKRANSVVELARFPLGSRSPTFKIVLEHRPQDKDGNFASCDLAVHSHPRTFPEQTTEHHDVFHRDKTKVQPIDSNVTPLAMRNNVTNLFVIGGNSEAVVVYGALMSGTVDDCTVTLRAEYHQNYKAFFTQWPR